MKHCGIRSPHTIKYSLLHATEMYLIVFMVNKSLSMSMSMSMSWEVMWSDNSGDLFLPGCQWQSKWVKCCKWRSWQKTWIQEWQIRCNARVLTQVMREKLLNLGDVWEQHIEIQWAKWCSEWKTKQSNSKEIVDQGSVRKSWKKYTSVGQSHTVECTPSHGFVHHDEKMDFHLYHNANGKTNTASDRWFSRVTDKDLLVMNSYPW